MKPLINILFVRVNEEQWNFEVKLHEKGYLVYNFLLILTSVYEKPTPKLWVF